MSRTIYTVGLGNDSVSSIVGFVTTMTGPRAVVVDVRRITVGRDPVTQEKRHTREELESECTKSKIEYTWEPNLAPSYVLHRKYSKKNKTKESWTQYVAEFLTQLETHEGKKGFAGLNHLISLNYDIVLLCSEKHPERCHRRIVAEAYAKDYLEETGLEVLVHNLVIGLKTEPYVPAKQTTQSALW